MPDYLHATSGTGKNALTCKHHSVMYTPATHELLHMTINIRNPEASRLARELARIDDTSITDAVIVALRETIRNRVKQETPRETAKRLLAKHGLSVQPGHKPALQDVYHDLDHDLTGSDVR